MTVNLQGFDYQRNILRPGQRRAIDVILGHRRAEQQFTSIQLVARYGKSDTIRLSAVEMANLGLIAHALIITPFDFLREQMLAEPILRASAQRYGFHRAMYGQVHTIDGVTPIRPARFDGRILSSITTPKAARPDNLAMLTSLARRSLNGPQGPGLPWAVYLDEAHMAGEGKAWGEIVPAFEEAGAYVIVLTGTPFRNDGSPIPGFERRLVEWTDRNGLPRVGWEHIADVAVTYADALQETPPPVAFIAYQPFGIAGDLIDRDTGEIRYTTLDDLEDDQIRAAYLPALSDPNIIAVPLRFMVHELKNRRAEPGQDGTQGVVFIGSDAEGVSDDEVKQGDTVEAMLRQLAPDLRVEQIHQKRRDGRDTVALLQEFQKGGIAIAIVKQMGTVGMDIPSLKVMTDLGNTRAHASMEQRIMRGATRWDVGGFVVSEALYIAPDDRITRELVETILQGKATVKPVLSGIGNGGGGGPRLPAEFVADRVILDGKMLDPTMETAPVKYADAADDFRARFPGTVNLPKVPLTQFIADWVGRPQSDGDPAPVVEVRPQSAPQGEEFPDGNLTHALMRRRKHLDTLIRDKANKEFRRLYGHPYKRGDKQDIQRYGVVKGAFQNSIYRKLDLPDGTSAENIDDIATLDRIIKAVQDT